MSSLIAGRGQERQKVISESKRNRKLEKIVEAMQKILDVSGVERHQKQTPDHATSIAKEINAEVKIVRGYLGNQLFFWRRGICAR